MPPAVLLFFQSMKGANPNQPYHVRNFTPPLYQISITLMTDLGATLAFTPSQQAASHNAAPK